MRNTEPNKCNHSGWFDHVTNASLPTIRLLFVIHMDKCAVFVAKYRGLDRYYNFIFAGRKISREENFAGGKFREIPFAVILFSREENFAQNTNSRI